MDMFNKLRNTVSNFSNVLLGNPVTREYEIIEHIASAGPALLWKVYKGIKKSTKEEAAVFVLEKKILEKYPKNERDAILNIARKGVANLTRLRHPSILTVQHSLEESRESLAFATEPVFASLANILGYQENMPIPPPKALKNFELYDIEIKYGFLQLTEGLAFLHNDVKMIHGNINLETILVNKNGAWKLAGFDFCIQLASDSNSQGDHYTFGEVEIERPPPCHPHLDYLAPECLLGSSNNIASDMFSLGVLFYSVYNKGRPLLSNSGCSLATIKQNFNYLKKLSPHALGDLPSESRNHVHMLLSMTPELRPDAFQTSKLPIFEDVGVKTLQYLDSLYQWDNFQKSQFYKGLPKIIENMPKRVQLHRVIPCLAKEYPTPEMVPFVLPNVLLIAEEVTKEEFQTFILADLYPLFRLQEPVQITLIFLQKMELLLSKCPKPVISNHILPLIHRALESDAQQIQELCLSIIPKFACLIEYSAMKNALLPRIKKLCINTSYLSVRVNSLVCLGKLLENLDKWLVLDEILPFLPQIPSKEPAVLMGILGILKLTMSHKKLGITKEIMATKIIPFLMPLSIENGLTLSQFNSIMVVIKDMVNQVEIEHKTKLEQLNSIRQEHNSTLEMVHANQTLVPGLPTESDNPQVDDMFKNLGVSTSFDDSSLNQKPSHTSQSNVFSNGLASENKNVMPLSMGEKKTIWKQEQQKCISKPTNLLQPSRDATSSLIDSNLKNLSLSKTPSTTSYISNTWSMNYSSPMQQQPQSLMGNYFSSPSSTPLQRFPYQNVPPPPPSNDFHSLDSLLPNMSTKSSMTLSQLSAQSPISVTIAPKLPMPPGYTAPTTPSAKNELEDLLG